MSHLIWDFVCLNKISVVPLALTIPFLFPNTSLQWRSDFCAHRPMLSEVAIKFHQIWTDILLL